MLATTIGLFTSATTQAYYQSQPSDKDSKAFIAAQNGAVLAGAGKYCNVDSDLLDEFTNSVEARIALLAKDDYEKIVGKLEFKNLFAATSAKEPEAGCDHIYNNFAALTRQY